MIDVKPIIPLSFLQVAQQAHSGQEHVFDVCKDDSASLLAQQLRLLHAVEEDFYNYLQISHVRTLRRDELENSFLSFAFLVRNHLQRGWSDDARPRGRTHGTGTCSLAAF